MKLFFGWHWDFFGFGASLLCALHCILMPLVFSLGIIAGGHWLMNPLGERIFIGISIGIAGWSLLQSYFNRHQNIRPLLIAGLGFLGLFLALARVISNVHGLMAIGGGLIALAHYYNWQLVHQTETIQIINNYWITPGRVITIILLLSLSLSQTKHS